MDKIIGAPSASFTNLYQYAAHDQHEFLKDFSMPGNDIDGTGVDVVIVDTGIDAPHYEFQDDNGNTRVQLVDWNYLIEHGDRLISEGIDGWNEWRSKDYTFQYIHDALNTLVTDYEVHSDSSDGYIYNSNLGYSQMLFDITESYRHYLPNVNYPAAFHGTHTAGTVAGRTVGWASNANIYAISANVYPRYGNASNEEYVYMLQMLKKASNISRPTVVNESRGSTAIVKVRDEALVNPLIREGELIPGSLNTDEASIDVNLPTGQGLADILEYKSFINNSVTVTRDGIPATFYAMDMYTGSLSTPDADTRIATYQAAHDAITSKYRYYPGRRAIRPQAKDTYLAYVNSANYSSVSQHVFIRNFINEGGMWCYSAMNDGNPTAPLDEILARPGAYRTTGSMSSRLETYATSSVLNVTKTTYMYRATKFSVSGDIRYLDFTDSVTTYPTADATALLFYTNNPVDLPGDAPLTDIYGPGVVNADSPMYDNAEAAKSALDISFVPLFYINEGTNTYDVELAVAMVGGFVGPSSVDTYLYNQTGSDGLYTSPVPIIQQQLIDNGSAAVVYTATDVYDDILDAIALSELDDNNEISFGYQLSAYQWYMGLRDTVFRTPVTPHANNVTFLGFDMKFNNDHALTIKVHNEYLGLLGQPRMDYTSSVIEQPLNTSYIASSTGNTSNLFHVNTLFNAISFFSKFNRFSLGWLEASGSSMDTYFRPSDLTTEETTPAGRPYRRYRSDLVYPDINLPSFFGSATPPSATDPESTYYSKGFSYRLDMIETNATTSGYNLIVIETSSVDTSPMIGLFPYGDQPQGYHIEPDVIVVGATDLHHDADPHAFYTWSPGQTLDANYQYYSNFIYRTHPAEKAAMFRSRFQTPPRLYNFVSMSEGDIPSTAHNNFSAAYSAHYTPFADDLPHTFSIPADTPTLPTSSHLVHDKVATYSNRGSRVDIFAPGSKILSAVIPSLEKANLVKLLMSRYSQTPGIPVHYYGWLNVADDNGEYTHMVIARQSAESQMPNTFSPYLYHHIPSDTFHSYGYSDGTSMAAPQVAGVLALYAQVNPAVNSTTAKRWLQEVAYDGYIVDPTKHLTTGIYNNPIIKKLQATPGQQQDVKLASESTFMDFLHAEHEDMEPRGCTSLTAYRAVLSQQGPNSDTAGLHGAPNKLLHWPYSNMNAADIQISNFAQNSNIVSNVILTGSVGITNLEAEYAQGLVVDRTNLDDGDRGSYIPAVPTSSYVTE